MTVGAVLELERTVKASPERVFKAWIDPTHIAKWFVPSPGMKMLVEGLDPRVGGKYRLSFDDGEGERISVSGEYRAVDPNSTLIFTWKWDSSEMQPGDSLVSVLLEPCEAGTRLTFRHELLASDHSRDQHKKGWTSILDTLTKYLANEGE